MIRKKLLGILLVLLTAAPCCAQKRAEAAVDALWAALAAADVGLSHVCIGAGQCREGNPLMPAGLGGAIAVEGAETGVSMWSFHRARKTHPRVAWLIPAANVSAHALGVWSFARKR